MNRHPRPRPGLFLLLGLLAVSGCSSFQREWKQAAAGPPAGLEGRWSGVWRSDANGHTGQLRCLVTRAEDGAYRARFHARYEKIFTFGYTVALQVRQPGDHFQFTGDANLGWYAGGVYHYEGTASATNFLATYRCPRDHGTFTLARPAPGE